MDKTTLAFVCLEIELVIFRLNERCESICHFVNEGLNNDRSEYIVIHCIENSSRLLTILGVYIIDSVNYDIN